MVFLVLYLESLLTEVALLLLSPSSQKMVQTASLD